MINMNKKVYVVAHNYEGQVENADGEVWTLSIDPLECGWQTDCGFPGYGLTKEVADAYAKALNENELLWKVANAADEYIEHGKGRLDLESALAVLRENK